MVDVATVALEVTAILNANPDAYEAATDGLFKSEEITAAVVNGDRAVTGVILDTAGHRSRNQYRSLVAVDSGQLILKPDADPYASFEGGISIDGKAGSPVSASAVRILQSNPNDLGGLEEGYYNVAGSLLEYTGSDGMAEVIDPAAIAFGTVIASPEEYIPAIVHYALGEVQGKQGTNTAAASFHYQAFSDLAKMIRQGATSLPAPTPFKQGGA